MQARYPSRTGPACADVAPRHGRTPAEPPVGCGAGNLGVTDAVRGTTEKEVWPCRGANPPVAQPAHALLRAASAELQSRACREPRRGLARRQAPVAEPRACRDAPADPIRSDQSPLEDARGGAPWPRHRRRAAEPHRARSAAPVARAHARSGAPAAPAPSAHPPHPGLRGRLRLHRLAGRPPRAGPCATRPARRSAGSMTSWPAGPTARCTRR